MKCSNCGVPTPTSLCVLCSIDRDNLAMMTGKFIPDHCSPLQINHEAIKSYYDQRLNSKLEKQIKDKY